MPPTMSDPDQLGAPKQRVRLHPLLEASQLASSVQATFWIVRLTKTPIILLTGIRVFPGETPSLYTNAIVRGAQRTKYSEIC